jgi:hypothetical protein
MVQENNQTFCLQLNLEDSRNTSQDHNARKFLKGVLAGKKGVELLSRPWV